MHNARRAAFHELESSAIAVAELELELDPALAELLSAPSALALAVPLLLSLPALLLPLPALLSPAFGASFDAIVGTMK